MSQLGRDHLFKGPFCLIFISAVLTCGKSTGVARHLGGLAIEAENGKQTLSDHGVMTEVSKTTWTIARWCNVFEIAGFVATLVSLILLLIEKVRAEEVDTRKD